MAKAANRLQIAIDLGSDTVKVAYAFVSTADEVEYGKLAPSDVTGSVVAPAIAYYDEDTSNWIFGENVYKNIDKSFVNVVKIKSLLSLLLKRADKDISRTNGKYYRNFKRFPKFYFPNKKKLAENFSEAVKMDMTFEADRTPKEVCEAFFEYLIVKTIIPSINKLQEQRSVVFDKVEYSVVYPAKAGKEYIEELQRLVRISCGLPIKKSLSSTKALGMFAYYRKMLRKGESALIFDMGEEDVSVAKLSLNDKESVIIDGVDGHNEPMEQGGNDVDYAVRDFIERTIGKRETMGAPPAGEDGYIAEKGLHSTQFLMLNEIKKAKTALSLDDEIYSLAFSDGVPMSIKRDVLVQTAITREDFVKSVGMADNTGIAREIAEYIISEMNRRINKDVKKIVLSGGVIETYGLIEYIKKQLKYAGLNVKLLTFDDGRSSDDGFAILSHEDSMFAPAVGGAIVALKNYEIKTAVALSYGTWLFNHSLQTKVLDVFLDRGMVLPSVGGEYFTSTYVNYQSIWKGGIENEELFSTTFGEKGDIIGEPNSKERKVCERELDLKVVAGGKGKGKVLFYFKDGVELRRVELQGKIFFQEGVKIDSDGRATPFIRNNLSKNGAYNKVSVRFMDGWEKGRTRVVCFQDIVLRFSGVDDFDVEGSD